MSVYAALRRKANTPFDGRSRDWPIITAVDEIGRRTADFILPTGGRSRATAPPRAPTITISALEIPVAVALTRHDA
ncbi:hypothetical protein MXEN_09444 [Mycobacterium xenopi RIVM700367]|nr:hypothetical protein MXEN_09444 [Mycobacterium xenopi RIVM700367]